MSVLTAVVWHATVRVRGRFDPKVKKDEEEGERKAALNARVAQRRKDLGRPDPPPRVDKAVPKMRGAVRVEAFRGGKEGARQWLAPRALSTHS